MKSGFRLRLPARDLRKWAERYDASVDEGRGADEAEAEIVEVA
jgi:hypothetical protein